jgi:dimethylglycine dehydrogenase
VGKSLALAYVASDVRERNDLTVYVIGEPKAARILPEPPYDPSGSRLRETGAREPSRTS